MQAVARLFTLREPWRVGASRWASLTGNLGEAIDDNACKELV